MERQRPVSFDKLMGLAIEEYQSFGTVFGVRNMYKAGRARLPIFGMRIENPVGPSASPVTQTAQGIIASYLSGARFIELKTVSPSSGTVIKPYVSLDGVTSVQEGSSGYTIEESFGEYVRAWYAIKLLSTHFELGVPEGFVFHMSLGGCLEDLKSDNMNSFIEGLKSAEYTGVWRECENWARAHMDEFDGIDNTFISDISPKISISATFVPNDGLSAQETEECARYLIVEKHLHTFVALSPELLGYYSIRGILDINGYTDIEIDEEKIKSSANYEDVKPALLRLQTAADRLRLEFGVKISDGMKTAVTRDKGESITGKALFPVTFSLCEKVANDFGGGLRICYSGGADRHTASGLFNCGIWPVTFASTLMMPGGLMRLYDIASDVSKCDYAQFSGILTSDIPDLEKEVYESGRYKYRGLSKAKKHNGPIPQINCHRSGCRAGCPLSLDIPYIERLLRNNRSLDALKVIFERNPMPFTCETLCSHPCTSSCALRFYDSPINIGSECLKAAKDACFDLLDETETRSRAGEKIAVVGAGIAGMSTACFLARQGADVTVFDRNERPGGAVMEYLPDFMIKESDVEWDMTLIQATGIGMELETEVHSIKQLMEMGFTKVVLATGAEKEKHLKLSFGKAVSALDFLKSVKYDHENAEEIFGGNIVVYGDGITAVTAARTAKKLPNADRVTLLLNALDGDELVSKSDRMLLSREGIFIEPVSIPVGLRQGELFCHKAARGEKNEKTGLYEITDTGEKCRMKCDIIINATGEEAEIPFLDEAGSETSFAGSASLGRNAIVPEIILDAQRLSSKLAHSHFDRYMPDNESVNTGFLSERGKMPQNVKDCERCLECETVCNFCIDCCPGRANMEIILSDDSRQVIHIDEFCDGCGACESLCPYEGSPYREKFTLFLDEDDFKKSENDGFYVTGEANNCRFRVEGRVLKYDPINGPLGIIPDEIREMAAIIMKHFPRFLKTE